MIDTTGTPSLAEEPGRLTFRNRWWELAIGTSPFVNPHRLVDLATGFVAADEDYCYSFSLSFSDGQRTASRVRYLSHSVGERPDGGRTLTVVGRLDFGLLGPADVEIEHSFCLPATEPWLEEQISLVHRYGRDSHQVSGLRCGFRKVVYDRDVEAWRDGLDAFKLVPVPHRRRWGQALDHHMVEYSMPDIIPASWGPRQLPGRGAEGWVWTNGERGLLIAKYNQTRIEFSLFDGEFLLAPSKRTDAYFQTFDPHIIGGNNFCARFGGVGLYNGNPEMAKQIGKEQETAFGVTRFYSLQGGWEDGYRLYKEHLRSRGHVVPKDWNPPVHWNELYNLGWRGGDNAPLQTLPQLYDEARIASEIGAESLYFDPVWDVLEGTTIWDEKRLGKLGDFVRKMREDYGLGVSLHLMNHTLALDEDPAIYRRDKDGSVVPWQLRLYTGAHICAGSKAWQELKTKRLLALAKEGVVFFMFDFLNYNPPGSGGSGRRPETPACWDPTHGHEVPLTLQGHADGILKVIQNVKREYPHVNIEAHDRISGGLQDYHPLYFQHALPHSFDSNWGFEYMWDPYVDLLSGKALSLYEYNLAYDIPLYLHIHCGQDNEQMLAFWWYASTCRHLGIGGVKDPDSKLYQALKAAMTTYVELKPFFARGDFHGLDQLAHLHSLPERNQAVINLFNLSGQEVSRRVEVDLKRVGLSEVRSVDGVEWERTPEGFAFRATLPALSPKLVGVNL